jgi:uncharacterized integral membrane protein
MSWKMVFVLVIIAIVVFFAGFNLTNASDISFGFATIEAVPIFISLFIAYLAGALTMLPLMIKSKRRKKKKSLEEGSAEPDLPQDIPDIPDIPELNEEK